VYVPLSGSGIGLRYGENSGKLMQKYRLWVAAKAELANREKESPEDLTNR
jgi:hypothetical protein